MNKLEMELITETAKYNYNLGYKNIEEPKSIPTKLIVQNGTTTVMEKNE